MSRPNSPIPGASSSHGLPRTNSSSDLEGINRPSSPANLPSASSVSNLSAGASSPPKSVVQGDDSQPGVSQSSALPEIEPLTSNPAKLAQKKLARQALLNKFINQEPTSEQTQALNEQLHQIVSQDTAGKTSAYNKLLKPFGMTASQELIDVTPANGGSSEASNLISSDANKPSLEKLFELHGNPKFLKQTGASPDEALKHMQTLRNDFKAAFEDKIKNEQNPAKKQALQNELNEILAGTSDKAKPGLQALPAGGGGETNRPEGPTDQDRINEFKQAEEKRNMELEKTGIQIIQMRIQLNQAAMDGMVRSCMAAIHGIANASR